jgi:hypothetical protein
MRRPANGNIIRHLPGCSGDLHAIFEKDFKIDQFLIEETAVKGGYKGRFRNWLGYYYSFMPPIIDKQGSKAIASQDNAVWRPLPLTLALAWAVCFIAKLSKGGENANTGLLVLIAVF